MSDVSALPTPLTRLTEDEPLLCNQRSGFRRGRDGEVVFLASRGAGCFARRATASRY